MSLSIARLSSTLSLNSVGFKNGLAQAKTSITAFGAISLGAFASIGSAAIGMASKLLSALPRVAIAGFHLGERLYDSSIQTGIAAKELQNLHRVAGLAGIGVEQFDDSIIKMNDSIGSALAGGKELAKTFAEIGLDASDLAKLKPDEALLRIVDAMNRLPDTASQTRVIRDIFGRAGGRLRTLAELGSIGITGEARRTRGLGLSLSDVEIKNIDRAKDAFADLKNIVSGFGLQLAVRLAPQIELLSSSVLEFATNTKIAIEAAAFVFNAFNTMVFATAELMRGLTVSGSILQLEVVSDKIANIRDEIDRLQKEDRTGKYRILDFATNAAGELELQTNAAKISALRSDMDDLTARRNALDVAIQGQHDNPVNAAYDFFRKQMELAYAPNRTGGSGSAALAGVDPYKGGFSRILGTAAIYSGAKDSQQEAVDELRKINQKLAEQKLRAPPPAPMPP